MDVEPILIGEVELKNILEKHTVYRIPTMLAIEQEAAKIGREEFATTERPEPLQNSVSQVNNFLRIKTTIAPIAVLLLTFGGYFLWQQDSVTVSVAGTWKCTFTQRLVEGGSFVGSSVLKFTPVNDTLYSYSIHLTMYGGPAKNVVHLIGKATGQATLENDELTLQAKNGEVRVNGTLTQRWIDGRRTEYRDGQWVEKDSGPPLVFQIKNDGMVKTSVNLSPSVLSEEYRCTPSNGV